MKKYMLTLIYGFAIFAMFFGSGNLVFPLQIGAQAGNHWVSAFMGLFCTGIALPFLGLFVIKLHHGHYEKFFAEAGQFASIALPLFTLSLLGSFGVVPRCITVAFGGAQAIFPHLSLIPFSIIFCIACFFVCLKDHFVVSILGKWMTPLLLTCLLILIALGVYFASPVEMHGTALSAWSGGFIRGYLTMDLFAAFFFSALIFKQIQGTMPEAPPIAIIRAAVKPSMIGAGLLALVYLGFVYLGAHYQAIVVKVAPELILPAIATHLLGQKAAWLICITLVLSCLTTAVALNNIYARFLTQMFKMKQHCFPLMLLGTTSVAFFISLLDFQGIAAFLGPILDVSYPGLIVLTLSSIFLRDHLVLKRTLFYGAVTIMLLFKLF